MESRTGRTKNDANNRENNQLADYHKGEVSRHDYSIQAGCRVCTHVFGQPAHQSR